MKTIRFLIAALLVTTTVSAQNNRDDYQPVVYLLGVQQTTVNDEAMSDAEYCTRNQMAIDRAILDFVETHRGGFEQAYLPQMIFSSRTNKIAFAVGGNVNMRVGYDFKGIVNSRDFIPADIPIPGNYNSRQKLMMDASTSSIYFKAVANNSTLGRVVAMFEADFRGSNTGYTPRVRLAYVSLYGFTLGRDVTTFCDLNSSPQTIDFEGPNAYTLDYATMIRYSHTFGRSFSMGIAAEMPRVSATYGETFTSIHQRVPDFPMYVQFNWGRRANSHVRVTGLLRNMYYHNQTKGENQSEFGWGVQLSGNIAIGERWNTYINGVYGKGVSSYVSDLKGAGMDLVVGVDDPTKLRTVPMYGWMAAGKFNIMRGLSISGGYSEVNVERKTGFWSPSQYKKGQYIFGNIFCHFTPRFEMAIEYLYGTHKNMAGNKNSANRIQAMVKYNF
ncbi:MAG: porin [Rikenellaceae bacterium]|nr:porin [Rikenellaceae bacterium]